MGKKKDAHPESAAGVAEKSGLAEKASVAVVQGSIIETGAAARFFAFSPSGARAKPLQMSRHRKGSPRRRHRGSKSPLPQHFLLEAAIAGTLGQERKWRGGRSAENKKGQRRVQGDK
ncbi:hypothetical protein HPB50_021548 [Hyalomma asiaticum]|uniref:Uncharacterized protein n=1 Tax=Hyalomma asiaticum TaxID=266040 RepID=A0ACB7TNU3_HYAAI|nr:hypothetical protein HPB50_021548 [Hyalomma asiaticum]